MAKKDTRTEDLVSYFFWTLLLQAIVFFGLAILMLSDPAILVILVAANFIWMGVTTLLLAWRVRKYKKVVLIEEGLAIG